MLGELGMYQVPRPSSSLSSRPASRSSHRHPARGRQSARHAPFAQDLVAQTLPCSRGDPKHIAHAESVMKALDSGRYNSPIWDSETVDKRIKNLVDKHRVLLNDGLAEALGTSYNLVRKHVTGSSTRESQVTIKNLPDVLQLLFALSTTPDRETHAYAATYLERQQHPNERPEEAFTWDKILQEEPFEGQHWEGAYGLPAGATMEGWETMNTYNLSESDLSDLGDFELPLKSRGEQKRDLSPPLLCHDGSESSDDDRSEDFDARIVMEEVKSSQYWRASAPISEHVGPTFDLGDPSSLALAVASIKPFLANQTESRPAVILEIDAVREALFMLQGNASIFTTVLENDPLNMPKIKGSTANHAGHLISHLSPAGFHSVLESLAQRATAMRQLRGFTRVVFDASYASPSSSHTQYPPSTRTLEAFAAALDAQIQKFDMWCAAYEEGICVSRNGKRGDPLSVCSLLSLEHRISKYMGASFDLLLKLVHDILALCSPAPRSMRAQGSEECPSRLFLVHPSILCTFMLDELLAAARSEHLRGLSASAQLIMEVFVTTAEPLWNILGIWMSRGMEFTDPSTVATAGSWNRSDSEFFIQQDKNIPADHSDFWLDGFKVVDGLSQDLGTHAVAGSVEQARDPRSQEFKLRTIPIIFRAFANEILSAGKSVGLLRVLQSDDFVSLDTSGINSQPLQHWPTFHEIIRDSADLMSLRDDEHSTANGPSHTPSNRENISLKDSNPIKTFPSELSADDVAMLVRESLEPRCRLAHARLNRVIADDCRIWYHIAAIEGLYFMRRGDTMGQFCQMLFSRVHDRQPWNDYHTLNTMFRDVAVSTLGDESWLDHRLVRLTFRGIRTKDPLQSIKAFDGLSLEYQVPFPLNYLFDPSSVRSYSSIFNLLLQLRFAKWILDGMVMRATRKGCDGAFSAEDLRMFYAVRGRLIWFVSTVMHHVAVNVIDLHVRRLHDSLQEAHSLDEMISFHANSLASLLSMCTIESSTSSVRRGILAILDLVLRLNEAYRDAQDRAPVDIPIALSRHAVEKRIGRSGRRRRRMNKVQRSRRRNIIGFSSEVHIASDDDPEDDVEAAQEEADILEEATRGDDSTLEYVNTTSKADESSMVASLSFSGAPFAQRIEKLGLELDVLVRYVMKHVEGLSEGGVCSTGLETGAFSMLNFAFEDWDL